MRATADIIQNELILPATPDSDARTVFRRIRNFLAGRALGATRDEALLRELLKCLYVRIHLEWNPRRLAGRSLAELASADPTILADLCADTFAEIRPTYPEMFGASEQLALDPGALAFTMGSLADLELLNGERDAIGDAYEVFIGSHVRGQDGQFFTPRNAAGLLVEAVRPSLGDAVIDPACGAGGFLTATLQHLARQGAGADALRGFARTQLFGIDKDAYLASLAQAHVSLVAGGKAHIVCADSLAWNPQEGERLDSFPGEGAYDVVLTNPPFGSNIVAATGAVLRSYQLARKWRSPRDEKRLMPTSEFQSNVPPQVLFMEKCVRLTRPGGRIGIVVPESLVSSKMHRYVIEYVRSECSIQAVIGMPENLFKTSGKGGTHTKTCLLLLERRSPRRKRPPAALFMAEARWCGHDSRGRAIPHDDLPAIQERLARARASEDLEPSPLGFVISEDQLVESVLAPRYYDPRVARGIAALRKTHDLLSFGELIERGVVELSTGDEIGKLSYGTGDIPFVRTSDLSNWEIKVDPKHGVSREVFERFRKKQDVRPGDILMVRDGTYLIGTCAIVTEHDKELLYQSHIYKIRVLANDLGLTPHLLLAVLSSEVVQEQIRAKRFTQDIIDSLGDRIAELVLPIWKDPAMRRKVTILVRKSVDTRAAAREASRRARDLVVRANA